LTVALVLTLPPTYETPRRPTYDNVFPNYYPERINQFNVTYMGTKPTTSFYVIITSVNASFPDQYYQNHIRVNSTAIKVLFTLGENGSTMEKDTQSMLFSINENVTGFSFTWDTESRVFYVLPLRDVYGVQYIWNETENYYELSSVRTGGQP
jgi:hypothetical protein